MKIIPLQLFALVSLLLFSCNHVKFQSEIAEIDSLKTELQNLDQRILDLDTAKLYARLSLQLNQMNTIQQNLDSISRREAFIVDEYARYKKAYSRWGEKIPVFFDEINLRTNQLSDLKQDIENGLLEKEKIVLYLENEKEHVSTLTKVIDEMKTGLTSIDSQYIYSQSRMDTIISRIANNSAQ